MTVLRSATAIHNWTCIIFGFKMTTEEISVNYTYLKIPVFYFKNINTVLYYHNIILIKTILFE